MRCSSSFTDLALCAFLCGMLCTAWRVQTCLAKSLAESRSRGFIFQLPAMKGTRAAIWHTPCWALTRSCAPLRLPKPDDAPWKAEVGATNAEAAGTPASTSAQEDEVNFMVVGREGMGSGWRELATSLCQA